MLKHIVMWKLKDVAGTAKAANAQRVKAALESCRGVTPGMLKYEVGLDVGSDHAPWDVVLYSEFADQAALQAYQQHPAHLAIKQVIGPLRENRGAVDYEVHKDVA
jgi:quinol monooxygenase YgiN